MVYVLCLMVFLAGLYAVALKRNIFKMILGIIIMEFGVNLFIITLGYDQKAHSVNYLAQSIVSVTLISGLATVILLSAIGARLYQRYKTLDIREIRKLRG